MRIKQLTKHLLPLAILGYTAFNSSELLSAWFFAPLDWFGWLPFIVWLIPLLIFRSKQGHPPFLWIALIATIAGNMASLNALRYLGFSASVVAWVPPSWKALFWWAGSIAWMPVFGWIASRYFPDYVLIGRLLLSALAVAVYYNQVRGSDA